MNITDVFISSLKMQVAQNDLGCTPLDLCLKRLIEIIWNQLDLILYYPNIFKDRLKWFLKDHESTQQVSKSVLPLGCPFILTYMKIMFKRSINRFIFLQNCKLKYYCPYILYQRLGDHYWHKWAQRSIPYFRPTQSNTIPHYITHLALLTIHDLDLPFFHIQTS